MAEDISKRADGADKGLLVDFGGVLTTDIWTSFASFCEAEHLDPDSVKELFRNDRAALADLRGLETGELDDAEFEGRFASRLGVSPTGLIDRLFAGLRPNEPMIEAVRSIRQAGTPTGLVSNSWGTGIYERAPLDLFDAAVISGDVGLHKPQPEIYELAAERLGVPSSACVFVDDLRENIEGAEAVGMSGVLHRDNETSIARLRELLPA